MISLGCAKNLVDAEIARSVSNAGCKSPRAGSRRSGGQHLRFHRFRERGMIEAISKRMSSVAESTNQKLIEQLNIATFCRRTAKQCGRHRARSGRELGRSSVTVVKQEVSNRPIWLRRYDLYSRLDTPVFG
jgi:hypothetical protein